jgi:dTDP-4-dehydrorhamnose 3,5-epimerase
MQIEQLAIADVKIITPRRFQDDRGFFSETWNARAFREAGIAAGFVQDNHAYSVDKGVVRGLHYQLPPSAQGKLVRVTKGSILDVAVDIRRGSPTFGRHVSAVLSAENWRQIWVPEGFAHGYVTLEPHTEVVYKVTELYAPALDRGILWSDPALGIDWGLAHGDAILSDKDRKQPRLAEATDLF